MPLQQSITDKSGVVSTYWVVTNFHVDLNSSIVSVTLSGYLNAATYAAGSQTSARRPFYFAIPFASMPSATSGTITLDEVYAALLTIVNDPANKSPLAGATIVS